MEEQNYKWGEYIWKNSLQRSFKVLTWGIDITSIDNSIDKGTQFHCYGRKMQGLISIQHEDWCNTFQITIKPDGQEEPIIIENVLLEKIVYVINESIEHYYKYHNTESQGYADVA